MLTVIFFFLENELDDFLDNVSLLQRQQIWFQQDGAPCHSRLDVRQYLQNRFNGRIIHRFSEISWPPRSPDLTPLDFFLWGYLKQKVYLQRPFTNVAHLERVIAESFVIEQLPALTEKADMLRRL